MPGRGSRYCHVEESDTVLRPEAWKWEDAKAAMGLYYGGDEFAHIPENVDKKMTGDYKPRLENQRAAKAAATAHPVTVDVPNYLNKAQQELLSAATLTFKDYDAGSVVMAGVNEAVTMAFVKLREEEEKKVLPPPMSPEDKKIADLKKQIEELEVAAASKELEATALGAALAAAAAASADQEEAQGGGASSSGKVEYGYVEDSDIAQTRTTTRTSRAGWCEVRGRPVGVRVRVIGRVP